MHKLDQDHILISGPLYNKYNSTHLMSFTFSVFGNTTIFVDSAQLSGYISIVFRANSFRAIIEDSTGLNDNGKMFLLSAVNNTDAIHLKENPILVQALLPATNSNTTIRGLHPVSDVPAVGLAIQAREPGSIIRSHLFNETGVSVGYALCEFFTAMWVIVITEPHSTVYAPIYKLRNITLISSSGVLVICTIVIIVCVHLGVQPIYRLKQAAEQTTLSFHYSKDSSSINQKEKPSNDEGEASGNAGRPIAKSFRSRLPRWKRSHPDAGELSDLETDSASSGTRTPTVGSFKIAGIATQETSSNSPTTVVNPSTHSDDGQNQEPSPSPPIKSVGCNVLPSLNLNQKRSCDNTEVVQMNGDSSTVEELAKLTDSHSSPPRRRMLIPARVHVRESRFFTDELVSLQYSFNRMADELEKQYTHLEDMVRDRTKELEAARVQAENANEAKSLFIANITHELRTPLNGILGMTAVSLTENNPAKVKRSLKVISKSGMLLLNLLNDLLTFSKNQIGNISIEEKDFFIREIISQLQAIYSKQAKEKRIKIEYDVSPIEAKNMVLFGDSGRILHVLLNIISNSLKFAPADSKIQVRIQCLQVGDTIIPTSDNSTSGREPSPTRTVVSESTCTTTNSPPVLHADTDQESMHELSLVASPLSINEGGSDSPASHPPIAQHSTESLVLTSTSSHDNPHHALSSSNALVLRQSLVNFVDPIPCVFRFEVEDNGPGVDPSRIDQLFEPFVQADQALSRRHGGAGLGLSICKQLVSLLGGTIVLRNSSPETGGFVVTVDLPLKQKMGPSRINGEEQVIPISSPESNPASDLTTFSRLQTIPISMPGSGSFISVPLERRPSQPKVPAAPQSYFEQPLTKAEREFSVSSGQEATQGLNPRCNKSEGGGAPAEVVRAHVLVAEDNMINQEIMKRMLGLEGIREVELAVNGEQAVAKVEDAIRRGVHYDIVFMDVQMPRMDGLQATRVIRTQLGYVYPIVALTAFADDENAKQCVDAGMESFLEKPIMRESLREVLVKYCPQGSLNDAVLPGANTFEKMLVTTPGSPLSP